MSRSVVFKVLTAGDGGVGKTTLLHRYIEGKFIQDTQMTLGVEFFRKEIKIGEDTTFLQLWDFGGQKQFRFMLQRYVTGARGAIIMFDLTRFQSLENIEEWVNICKKGDDNIAMILIGTKSDLGEEITIDENYVLDIKEEFNFIDYIKVSSKTGENIDNLFKILTKEILKRFIY